MSGRSATYSTILPDDTGNDSYREHAPGYSGGTPSQNDMRARRQSPTPTPIPSDQKSASEKASPPPLDEREMLKKQITNNKTILYGLLFIAAILLIALGVVVIQNRRLAASDQIIQPGSIVTPGTDPPNEHPANWPNTQTQSEDKQLPTSSSGRAAAQNDKILRQRQHRAPVQNQQSALTRRRHGHSDLDDKKRLDTIIEGSESPVDDVEARTRSYISTQLRQDAEADARDEELGTGSFDLTAAVAEEKYTQTPIIEDERDEALIDQDDTGDADDEENPEKITVLCQTIMVGGRRAGQECNRECAPGKSMCKAHLGTSARKNKG